MQFAESNLIWLLTLVPLVALLRYYSFYSKHKELSSLATPEVIKKIFVGFENYARRSFWQGSFIALFVLLIVIAALRPQYGFVWQESKRKGVDIVVAIDVSSSMLSEDVKPNRLQRAKREIYDLLEELQGDRISLVAFSGVAFTEAPLTEDYATFRLFLKLLETSLIPVPGTNIGAALEKSIEAFGTVDALKKSQKSRAIVLITDGEDLEGEYKAKAQKAKELGIKIFILGVGTTEGAPINTPDGYKKDYKGTIIITKLNETVLKELAENTGGIYVQSMTSEADTDLLYKMGIKKQLEDQAQKSTRAKRWNEYFQFPLAIALVIMLWSPILRTLEAFRQYRRDRKLSSHTISVLFLLLGLASFYPESVLAQNKERLGKEAFDHYQNGDFESSRKSFETGAADFAQDYRFDIGSGAANYRLGNFQQAAKFFHDAFEKTKDPKEQAKVLYDRGNAMVQLDQLEEAIKAYEDSLKLVADDKNTIENLAYAKRLLEQQKQQDQKDDNKNDQKDKKDENQESKKDPQQDQNQDKTDQQKSDQDKSENNSQDENQQNKQEEQQKSEQNQQQNTQQQEKESTEPQDKSDKGSESSDAKDSFNHGEEGKEISEQQAESILEGVQENRNNLQNFRKQEALEQLRQMGKTRVEKDW